MALKVRLRAVILFSGIVLFGLAVAGRAETPGNQPVRITGIEWQETADSFLVTIRSEVPPTYTMYELFNPSRVILDIADATLAESAGLPKEVHKGPVAAITGRILDDQEPLITRIEIETTKDSPFTVDRDENNIRVKFTSAPARKADFEPSVAAPLPGKKGGAGPPIDSLLLEDVVVTAEPSATRVLLQTGAPITEYRKVRLPREAGHPDRLYIDIPHARMAENGKHITVGKALARVRMAHRGTGVRVVFDSGLGGPFNYDVETVSQGLMVTIPEPGTLATVAELIEDKQPVMRGNTPGDKDSLSAEVDPAIPAVTRPRESQKQQPREMPGPSAPAENDQALPPIADELALAGYVAQKISVDFYKIDLHNVFRLIGEISGRNIVVDEAVNGTLTLALNEVPWDFVLDVVINLKDLHKEERFNTIVISPKAKEYSWPKRPVESLAIAANGITRQEAISIKKKLETPKEVIEAKKLILQGNEHYRAGKFEAAMPVYEEAYSKWPDGQLAGRIAAMALAQLGQNAKAVHYAKAVLEAEPGNPEAALNAAIATANMKKTVEAKEYFDLAIASNRPSAEALLSYAAFCEDNDSLEASLVLLTKHEAIHGDNLESMIAKARVQDKLGRSKEANEEYRAILASGFDIPADLKRYIDGRIAVAK